VRGLDFGASDPSLLRQLPALPFLLLFSTGLLAAGLRQPRLAAWLLGAAIGALLALPVYAWMLDTTWFQRYLLDSIDLQKLLAFVNSFVDAPNISLNVLAVKGAEDYRYLPDRLDIIAAMLGWGWMISLLASVAALLLLRRLDRLPPLSALLAPLALSVLLLLLASLPALRGDFFFRQADQRMALGDYSAALASYTRAIENDAQLGRSPTLMLSVTRASFQQSGTASPYGRMYLAVAQSGSLSVTHASLLDAVVAAPDAGPLGAPLKDMALRLQAQLWYKRGLQAFRRGEYSAAELAFRRALNAHPDWRHVQFSLARTLWMLHAHDESLVQLDQLTLRISNPSILANIYNTIGDVQASAGRPELARQAYQQAYTLDDKGNLWAVKGLGGT
jgi:tetratricopeptide (TPR) repeat protein